LNKLREKQEKVKKNISKGKKVTIILKWMRQKCSLTGWVRNLTNIQRNTIRK
jgi:hypothetical protein